MNQFSVFMPEMDKNVDAHHDHLLVLNHLIHRRDNEYTPYLFSAFQHENKRWYCIQADWLDIKEEYRDVSEQTPDLSEFSSKDNCLSFFIRLNPAVKRTLSDPKRGKYDRIVPIKDISESINWLKSQLSDNGFATQSAKICYQQVTPCSRGNTVINDMLFHVTGYIFDLDNFEHAQNSGIGKRKGYGFGMIIPENTIAYSILEKNYPFN